ncbi:hypothetical protein ACRRTK_021375 [Alexandromys fortis]
MATEGDVELELETETSGPERPPEKPQKQDSGAADLERVTDSAEEKEIRVRIWRQLCPSLETDGPGSKRQNTGGKGTGEGSAPWEAEPLFRLTSKPATQRPQEPPARSKILLQDTPIRIPFLLDREGTKPSQP